MLSGRTFIGKAALIAWSTCFRRDARAGMTLTAGSLLVGARAQHILGGYWIVRIRGR